VKGQIRRSAFTTYDMIERHKTGSVFKILFRNGCDGKSPLGDTRMVRLDPLEGKKVLLLFSVIDLYSFIFSIF